MAVNDPWNQERSTLNHTEFGNGVLRFWTDTSRWRGVIRYICEANGNWSEESHQAWVGSFARWHEIRPRMVTHSRGIFTEYRPLRDGEELLKGSASHIKYCIAASRRLLENEGRYAQWVAGVAAAVVAVDTQAAAVEQLMRNKETTGSAESEVRSALECLSEAGKHLKDVFSGRGYFNYGGSD